MIAHALRSRESHCVRSRYVKSSCTLCRDACPHDAVTLSPAAAIDAEKCTECLACVAACRTASLEAPEVLFWETVRVLSEAPQPVLGCTRKDGVQAHAHLPCVGFLSAEYLMALAVFVEQGLTLNLVECDTCEDACVSEAVVSRLQILAQALPAHLVSRLAIATTAEALEFAPIETDRRGFLKALGTMMRNQTAGVLARARDTDVGATPYWEKIVPRERLVFERIIEAVAEAGDAEGLEAACATLGYRAEVDDTCQLCFGCVGMCPNGALDSSEEEIEVDGVPVADDRLLFIASRCSGCGVCEEFCTSHSIHIASGCTVSESLEWHEVFTNRPADAS